MRESARFTRQQTAFADRRRGPARRPHAALRMRCWLACALVVAGLARSAGARPGQHGDTGFVHDKADQAFMQSVVAALSNEAQWSAVAARQASAPPVRTLAASAATEPLPLEQEVRQLAARRGIPMPSVEDLAGDPARDRFAALSGASLDRAYLDALSRFRQTLVDLFDHEASLGLDLELKAWAAARLPAIRARLQPLRTLR